MTMKILFKYLLQELVKVFAMCFAGLMSVYLVVDFFEKLRKFLKHDAEWVDILLYFGLKIPHISFQIAPVAILMATLLSLGILSRNNEITAMRSSGMSLFRITLPFTCFAAAAALALLFLSAVIVPLSNLRAEDVKNVRIKKERVAHAFRAERTWVEVGAHLLMNIESVGHGGNTLHGVSLYRLGPNFQLAEVIEAREVHHTDGGWVLRTGTQRTLLRNGMVRTIPFEARPVALPQIPEDFDTRLAVESAEMTLAELKAYAERLHRSGYTYSRFLTDYYGRVAFPFVALVMGIVGIALSLRVAGIRGGGMARGIGLALLISFLYWTTHSVAIALGHGGVLMPMLAGWFANLVFFTFGFYLLLRVRY